MSERTNPGRSGRRILTALSAGLMVCLFAACEGEDVPPAVNQMTVDPNLLGVVQVTPDTEPTYAMDTPPVPSSIDIGTAVGPGNVPVVVADNTDSSEPEVAVGAPPVPPAAEPVVAVGEPPVPPSGEPAVAVGAPPVPPATDPEVAVGPPPVPSIPVAQASDTPDAPLGASNLPPVPMPVTTSAP